MRASCYLTVRLLDVDGSAGVYAVIRSKYNQSAQGPAACVQSEKQTLVRFQRINSNAEH